MATGPVRLADADRAALAALQRGRDWLWVAGNHDPDPSDQVAGSFAATLAIGALMFRHAPQSRRGHRRGGRSSASGGAGERARPHRAAALFRSDRRRVVLPAFGAYAGGLNVRDRAFADIFGTLAFTAHMLGEARIYAFAATHCLERLTKLSVDAPSALQSRRNTTLANQPVTIAIIAVARP